MDIGGATVGGGGGSGPTEMCLACWRLWWGLLVISAVGWALTDAEVMTLVPAPAHAHPGE